MEWADKGQWREVIKITPVNSVSIEESSREAWREWDQEHMEMNYPSKTEKHTSFGTKEKAGKEKENTVDQC